MTPPMLDTFRTSGRVRRVPFRRVIVRAWDMIIDVASPHLVMLSNATAMVAGSVLASVLGFAYWWFAARALTPEAVGLASTAMAITSALTFIGEFGLGTLLLEEIPRQRAAAARVIAASLAAASLITGCLALAYVAVGRHYLPSLGLLSDLPSGRALLVGGIILTSIASVVDQALIGCLRGALQLKRNGIFAASRLVFLVAAVFGLSRNGGEYTLFACWALGNALSLIWLCFAARVKPSATRIDFGALRGLRTRVLGHHMVNVAAALPNLLLPVVVTAMLSAKVTGAFYAAWMLISFTFLIPGALTSVLFTVGTRDPDLLPKQIRFTLTLAAWLSLAVALSFFVMADFTLRIFGPVYADMAGHGLQILGCATLPVTIKHHFIAIRRLQHRTVGAAMLLAAGAVLELGMAAFGAKVGNLNGLCLGWTLAIAIEACVMLPVILSSLKRNDGQQPPVNQQNATG